MKIYKFTDSFFKKIICLMLAFALLPWNCLVPIDVNAAAGSSMNNHETYFLSANFNDAGNYVLQILKSEGWGDTLEERRMQTNLGGEYTADGGSTAKYMNWSGLASSTSPLDASKFNFESNVSNTKIADKDIKALPFSFPAYGKSGSYSKDYQRAIEVKDEMEKGINTILDTLKGAAGISFTGDMSSKDKIEYSMGLVDACINSFSSEGNWITAKIGSTTIYFANGSGYSYFSDKSLKKDKIGDVEVTWNDTEGNLMAYIVPEKENADAAKGFIWAMPKGYLNTNNEKSNTFGLTTGSNIPSEAGADAIWLTIFTFMNYANAQVKIGDVKTGDVVADENFVEVTLVEIFMGAVTGLGSLLGLKSIPQLIYNDGVSTEGGMMDAAWWDVVIKYHMIFQIIAWMLLIAAVAKILIQMNFASINPQMTMSVMDSLEKILTVGFALALCIPLIRAMCEFNNLIVGVFATQAQLNNFTPLSMTLAGVVILLTEIGIYIAMNGIYIMRAIMIALLTASAPLFIVSMAFSGPKQKGLMDNWLKEIAANIFMQAIHAFAFAFLWDVMDSSRTIVQLVIFLSLFPIVDAFRQLIFGQSGGFAVAQGQNAAQAVQAKVSQQVGAYGRTIGNTAMEFAAGKINSNPNKPKIDLAVGDTGAQGSKGGGKGSGEQSRNIAKNNTEAFSEYMKKLDANNFSDGMLSKETKSKLANVGGSVLSTLNKGKEFYDSTGGIMGNAAMRANLRDIPGSVQAARSEGEGTAIGLNRLARDTKDFIQNRQDSKALGELSSINEEQTKVQNNLSSTNNMMNKIASNRGSDFLDVTDDEFNKVSTNVFNKKYGAGADKDYRKLQKLRGIQSNNNAKNTTLSNRKAVIEKTREDIFNASNSHVKQEDGQAAIQIDSRYLGESDAQGNTTISAYGCQALGADRIAMLEANGADVERNSNGVVTKINLGTRLDTNAKNGMASGIVKANTTSKQASIAQMQQQAAQMQQQAAQMLMNTNPPNGNINSLNGNINPPNG